MNRIATALLTRAMRTPYFHLDGYMDRYWLFGGSHRDRREDDQLGWKRRWLDRLIGRFIAARIHITYSSDAERHLHDHPWFNVSILLDGQYIEWLPRRQDQAPWLDRNPRRQRCRLRKPGRIVFRRARSRHRLELIDGQPVVSLFLMGPKRRGWGFHTPDGFIPWRQYRDYLAANPAQFGGAGNERL